MSPPHATGVPAGSTEEQGLTQMPPASPAPRGEGALGARLRQGDRRLGSQWVGTRHRDVWWDRRDGEGAGQSGAGLGAVCRASPHSGGWESSQWCPGLNVPVRRLGQGRGRPQFSPDRGCIQPGPRGLPPSAGWREGTRPGAGHCVSEGCFGLCLEGQLGQEQPCGAGGPVDKVGRQSQALGCQGAARGEALAGPWPAMEQGLRWLW